MNILEIVNNNILFFELLKIKYLITEKFTNIQ